ncbi:MAG: cyanamide hydratase [Actinomycetes bacterium]
MRLADVPVPETAVAAQAVEAAQTYCSPALMQHNHRSYLWAAAHGVERGLHFDAELLFVAAMLHDIGLVAEFDNASLSFEHGGGHVAWMFAAGAGWPVGRRLRVAEVIVRHMWDSVDVEMDPEGYLLEVGTGLDISGRNPDWWPAALRAEVLAAHPRLDLAAEFLACFTDQAKRKPASSPASALGNGIATRIKSNVLDHPGE